MPGQQIKFKKYIRVVLPLDGYVFWVRATLLNVAANINGMPLNVFGPNNTPANTPPATSEMCVTGSLHYMTSSSQDYDASYAVNAVVFTAEELVTDFNTIAPNEMWIGEFEDIRFGFSQRHMYYEQSGLHHYTGNAIYPGMSINVIDDTRLLDTQNVIVSNSLPIWLMMNMMAPPYPYPPSASLQLYPSFLLPDNIIPPYGAVHIPSESTTAIQPTPRIDNNGSHWQLVEETVEFVISGTRNYNIMDFLDFLYAYSVGTVDDVFGIMDYPVVQDEKVTQVELGIIALKKRVTMRVNYYQQRVRNLAQQLIKTVVVQETVGDRFFEQVIAPVIPVNP